MSGIDKPFPMDKLLPPGGLLSEIGIKTVPCALCGKMTAHLGTRRCDRCWELEHRIERDPDLAREILERVERGYPRP